MTTAPQKPWNNYVNLLFTIIFKFHYCPSFNFRFEFLKFTITLRVHLLIGTRWCNKWKIVNCKLKTWEHTIYIYSVWFGDWLVSFSFKSSYLWITNGQIGKTNWKWMMWRRLLNYYNQFFEYIFGIFIFCLLIYWNWKSCAGGINFKLKWLRR